MRRIETTIMVLIAATIMTAQFASAQGLKNEEYSFQPKSPSRALLCSFLTTAVPVIGGIKLAMTNELGEGEMVLIYGGLIVGPATGYIYGKCPMRGLAGIAIRGGTAALTVYAAQRAAKAHKDDGWFAGLEAGLQVGAVGTGIIIIESLVDIALVYHTVEENNNKIAKQHANITLLPTYFADSGAGGLELNIRF